MVRLGTVNLALGTPPDFRTAPQGCKIMGLSEKKNSESGVASHRRTLGGARQEATERAVLHGPNDFEVSGWTLNVSRGGARLVLFDEEVQTGVEYMVTLGDKARPRAAHVIWVRDEPDGQIVGVKFKDVDGTVPPPPGLLEQREAYRRTPPPRRDSEPPPPDS